MKTTALFIYLGLLAVTLDAQELKWANEYFYVDNITEASQISVSPAKDIAVAGQFESYDQERQGLHLCVVNKDGNVLWGDTVEQTSVSIPAVEPRALEYNMSGDLYLGINFAGSIKIDGITYSTTGRDVLFIKYNSAGQKTWIRQLPFANINDLCIDKYNNMFVQLTTSQSFSIQASSFTAQGASDIFVLKMSPSDSIIMSQQISGKVRGLSVKTTKTGQIVIFGAISDSAVYMSQKLGWSHQPGEDTFVMRTDSMGVFVSYSNGFTTPLYDPKYMTVLDNGYAAVCVDHEYKSITSGLAILDEAGQLVTERAFSGYEYGSSHRIPRIAAYKNSIWAYHSEHNTVNYGVDGDDFSNIELAKYDVNLNTMLRDTFIIANSSVPGDICVDADGDIYMTGSILPNDSLRIGTRLLINGDEYGLHSTFFIARFADKMNTLSAVSRPVQVNQTPLYPNPTNGQLFVDAAFKGGNLTVYNLLGSRVWSGVVQSSVDLQHLERGVYLAEISSGSRVSIQRVVVR